MVIVNLKTVVPSNGSYAKALAKRFTITVKVESNGMVAWHKSSLMSAAKAFDDWKNGAGDNGKVPVIAAYFPARN